MRHLIRKARVEPRAIPGVPLHVYRVISTAVLRSRRSPALPCRPKTNPRNRIRDQDGLRHRKACAFLPHSIFAQSSLMLPFRFLIFFRRPLRRGQYGQPCSSSTRSSRRGKRIKKAGVPVLFGNPGLLSAHGRLSVEPQRGFHAAKIKEAEAIRRNYCAFPLHAGVLLFPKFIVHPYITLSRGRQARGDIPVKFPVSSLSCLPSPVLVSSKRAIFLCMKRTKLKRTSTLNRWKNGSLHPAIKKPEAETFCNHNVKKV